jgi:UTP--glucose-1-phosphate uridylyltransferase
LLQVRGHQRAPSGSREFKELTKRDAQIQLQHELNKLLSTVPEARQPSVKKDLDGFAQLFHRFLQEEGPSVDWERIEKLPENAVSHSRIHSTLPHKSVLQQTLLRL